LWWYTNPFWFFTGPRQWLELYESTYFPFFSTTLKPSLFFSGARHCDPVYPEECPEVHGSAGVAVVAPAHQAHADAQRPSDGGSTQITNGQLKLNKKKYI
jgi:hypothetical protein